MKSLSSRPWLRVRLQPAKIPQSSTGSRVIVPFLVVSWSIPDAKPLHSNDKSVHVPQGSPFKARVQRQVSWSHFDSRPL